MLTLWLWAFLGAVFIALPPLAARGFGFHLDPNQGTSVSLGGVLLSEVVGFLALLAWIRRRSVPLRSLGFIRPVRWSPVGVALLFAVGYAGWTLSIPEVRCRAGEISLLKAWGALVSVIGALVEETVFRGFLLAELERLGKPSWVQVVVSGFTFGLLHLGFGGWGIACTTLMGIVLAITYLWGGRSLLAPLAGHALINVAVEPWLLAYLITSYASGFPK